MPMELIDETKEKMTKTLSVLKAELAGLRAGRANAQVLDRIAVDYYGSMTPINQLGNISTPEPRMLIIALWDTKMIPAVEKAIQKSDLGINPANDGKIIRLVFPELTEERRKDLVKTVRKKGEESKVAIRNIRRDLNDQIKKQKKDSLITEDDQKMLEEKGQKLTDAFIKDIDASLAAKEKEILSVGRTSSDWTLKRRKRCLGRTENLSASWRYARKRAARVLIAA